MTSHLSDIETFAAADGSLEANRRAHLDACDVCRSGVVEARALLGRVGAADVPEPSPLFWDHFGARVRRATRDEPVASRAASSWRAWASLSAAAATVFLAAWLVNQPMSVDPGTSAGNPLVAVSDGAGLDPAGDVAWESVLATTTEWDADELFGLAGDATVSIDELTADERVAFVRLLEQELEVLQ